jgi:succinate dehydrogenase/fumarate reductase flavoprotein subunit
MGRRLGADKDGRITQITAPGHDRARCAYVDFINTGPAVSKTLRSVINRMGAIRKAGDLCVVDLIVVGGEVAGALALQLSSGAAVVIAAKATILATGGLTRLYQRNSASANMGGDGYALALRAGAELIDMEFVHPPIHPPHPTPSRSATSSGDGCSMERCRNSHRAMAHESADIPHGTWPLMPS